MRGGRVVGDITVLLVDPHVMVAECVRRVLGEGGEIEVVGVARTAAEAMAVAIDRRPDVILMDYVLPDSNGAIAAREILARSPDAKILLLIGIEESTALTDAVDAGCVGYLEKTNTLDKLVAAVHAVAAGEVVLSPGELGRVSAQRVEPGVGAARLTPRELEILDLLGEGLSNQAIASRLTLSINTVRTHVQSVLRKLNAHSKLEAVMIATSRGLLTRR
jgi:DNA-binding NarL/FixJ family response regulator